MPKRINFCALAGFDESIFVAAHNKSVQGYRLVQYRTPKWTKIGQPIVAYCGVYRLCIVVTVQLNDQINVQMNLLWNVQLNDQINVQMNAH